MKMRKNWNNDVTLVIVYMAFIICWLTGINRLGEPLINSWIAEAAKWTPRHSTVCDFIKRGGTADVYVITMTTLQRRRTAELIRRLNYKIVIVDECHSWVRGRPEQVSSQLTEFRSFLAPKAQAVYFLSGTPFKGDLHFDVVETIKSLAPAGRRGTWTGNVTPDGQNAQVPVNAYTDEALRNLYVDWDRIPSEYKSQVFLPIMLRRTPQTSIEGKPGISNYLALLVEMKEGNIDISTI